MANNVDTAELKAFANRLKKADNAAFETAKKAALSDCADRFVRYVRKKTPVKSGHLKGSWHRDSIKERGKTLSVDIYNQVNYASYVEYGHRTRNGKGWVDGKYMMTKAQTFLNSKMSDIVAKHIKGAMESVINGK